MYLLSQGSTYKRKASKAERAKETPTLKDLDFLNDHPEVLLDEIDNRQNRRLTASSLNNNDFIQLQIILFMVHSYTPDIHN